MYLKDKDLEKCQRMIKKYTDTWGCESRRYLPDIKENSYVEKVFHILALLMVQNKAVKQELFSGIENIIDSDKESLEMVSGPISLNQFPKVKIDLRRIIEYARSQEKKVE